MSLKEGNPLYIDDIFSCQNVTAPFLLNIWTGILHVHALQTQSYIMKNRWLKVNTQLFNSPWNIRLIRLNYWEEELENFLRQTWQENIIHTLTECHHFSDTSSVLRTKRLAGIHIDLDIHLKFVHRRAIEEEIMTLELPSLYRQRRKSDQSKSRILGQLSRLRLMSYSRLNQCHRICTLFYLAVVRIRIRIRISFNSIWSIIV